MSYYDSAIGRYMYDLVLNYTPKPEPPPEYVRNLGPVELAELNLVNHLLRGKRPKIHLTRHEKKTLKLWNHEITFCSFTTMPRVILLRIEPEHTDLPPVHSYILGTIDPETLRPRKIVKHRGFIDLELHKQIKRKKVIARQTELIDLLMAEETVQASKNGKTLHIDLDTYGKLAVSVKDPVTRPNLLSRFFDMFSGHSKN